MTATGIGWPPGRGDHVARVTHDALDRPWRRARGEQGKGHREVVFDYDAVGNAVRVTRGAGAEASITLFEYDGFGRVVTITGAERDDRERLP